MDHPGSTEMSRATDVTQPLGSDATIGAMPDRANWIVTAYILEKSPEYRELSRLRKIGWDNPEGDRVFREQRRIADSNDKKVAKGMHRLMIRIGEELDNATKAFTCPESRSAAIFDMCMAPGGFLETAMRRNRGSHATAFTLPRSSGGHEVLLPRDLNVTKYYMDITMLAEDMGATHWAPDHADASNFLPRQLGPQRRFDLVLCDGQVLRTHHRAAYREPREARRLTLTQLALGLSHLRPGGTMVVLLHKLEAWDTLRLVHTFRAFADIQLYKPRTAHTFRSSFYMVATNVRSDDPRAAAAVAGWKEGWRVATFGSDEEYAALLRDGQADVDAVLADFGPALVEMGADIWRIQAEALAQKPFVRDWAGAQQPAARNPNLGPGNPGISFDLEL